MQSQQPDPQATAIQGATMLQPSGGSLATAPTPDAIAEWKSRYAAPQPLKTHPVRVGGIDKQVAIALIAGVATMITLPSTAFIIASSVPNASNERMTHHLLQQQAQMMSELQKPRKICILANCPPDRIEPSTGTPIAPPPVEYATEQPQQPLNEYRWEAETPQQSTVVLADGTVVNVPPTQPQGY